MSDSGETCYRRHARRHTWNGQSVGHGRSGVLGGRYSSWRSTRARVVEDSAAGELHQPQSALRSGEIDVYRPLTAMSSLPDGWMAKLTLHLREFPRSTRAGPCLLSPVRECRVERRGIHTYWSTAPARGLRNCEMFRLRAPRSLARPGPIPTHAVGCSDLAQLY